MAVIMQWSFAELLVDLHDCRLSWFSNIKVLVFPFSHYHRDTVHPGRKKGLKENLFRYDNT